MRLPILISLSIAFSLQCFAQSLRSSVSFQSSVDYGGNNQDILTVIRGNSPYFVMGGYSNSGESGDKFTPNKGGWDYWIVNSNVPFPEWFTNVNDWDADFGGTGDDYLTDLIKTNDGGFLLAGYSNSNTSGDKTQDTKGETDFWIVKIDSNRNKIWDKDFGGSCYDYLYSIQQTADGGYVLAGYTCSSASGDVTDTLKGLQNFWLVKIDANGNKQWDHTYGSNGVDYCNHVEVVADGYVMFGYTNGTGGDVTQPSRGGYDYWLIKVGLNGKEMWDARYGSSDDDLGNYFTKTPDGGFLLGGTSAGNMSGDKSQNSLGGKDLWIIRIDSTGNKLWDKVYGGAQDDVLSGNVSLTTDNGFLLSGASASYSGTYKQENNIGTMQAWMVKIDSNGNYQWDRTFLTDGHDQEGFARQQDDTTFLLGSYTNTAETFETESTFNNSDDYTTAAFHKWTNPVFRHISMADTAFCTFVGLDTFNFTANTLVNFSTVYAIDSNGKAEIITGINRNITYKDSLIGASYQPGTFSLMWVISNPAGSDTIQQHNAITVYPLVYANFHLRNDTLFSDSVAPGLHYQWSRSFTLSIPGATNSYYVPQNSGYYTLCVETAHGCRDCYTNLVIVPGSTIILNGSNYPTYVCPDSCITFSLNATPAPDSISWAFELPILSYPNNYEYTSQQHPTVCYRDSDGGWGPNTFDIIAFLHYGLQIDTVDFQGMVNIYSLAIGGRNYYEYNGDSLSTFYGNLLTGYYHYKLQWFRNNQLLPGDTSYEIKPLRPGMYNLYVENSWGCHAFWAPFTIPSTTANFTSNIAVACDSAYIKFQDLSEGYPIGWRWYFPGAVPDTSTAEDPYNIYYGKPGTYNVKLVTLSNAGNDSIVYNGFIKIYSFPAEPVIQQQGDTFCTGSAFICTLSASSDSGSLQWQSGSDSVSFVTVPGATSATYNASGLQQNTYYRMALNNGCGIAYSNVLKITVVPSPAGIISASTDTICPNTFDKLVAHGSDGSLQWQSSESNGNYKNISSATDSSLSQLISQTTWYRIVTTNAFCSDTSAPFRMYVGAVPQASFTSSNSALVVKFISSGTGDVVKWSWDFGDGDTSSLANPTHTYSHADTFQVCLTVFNNTNCDFTTCLDVTIFNTGVEQLIINNESWIIVPNPTEGEFQISPPDQRAGDSKFKIERIEVYNVLGEKILEQQTSPSQEGSTKNINISNHSPGIYFLKVYDENGNITTAKVVKE